MTAAAGALIEAERADARLNPLAVTRLLVHGRAAARSVVLFHGFTNCPQQMAELGALFFARGWNVLVPRLPRHGCADRLTTAIAGLTAAELEACADRAFVWAQGLGDAVDVMGISLGGVLAAWIAQLRPARTALALSPFFALPVVPVVLSDALVAPMCALPPYFVWWDPRVRAACRPDHAYPRFPTTALGQCLALGRQVRTAARSAPPCARRIVVATNAQEPACNNAATAHLAARWSSAGGDVESHVLADVGRRHDIVEPETFPQARKLVYPRILDWIA